jgi:hypothetical protein
LPIHTLPFATSFALLKAGKSMAARIAIMAITTRSSINVKSLRCKDLRLFLHSSPCRRFRVFFSIATSPFFGCYFLFLNFSFNEKFSSITDNLHHFSLFTFHSCPLARDGQLYTPGTPSPSLAASAHANFAIRKIPEYNFNTDE